MKHRSSLENITHKALRFAALYVATVVLFALAKCVFMWVQPSDVAGDYGLTDMWQVVSHGLPLDFATTGYLTAVVWLVLGVSIWVNVKGWRVMFRVYAAIVAAALALILVGDACLYSFWHTKLDATVWNYLAQPQGIVQSVTTTYALCATLAVIATGIIVYYVWTFAFIPHEKSPHTAHNRSKGKAASLRVRILTTIVWALTGGLLFLGIRGGVGKSTANVGMVYFSPNAFLNHAAVNPAFSLLSSSLKGHDYGKQAHFFEDSERSRIMSMLGYTTESVETEKLLRTDRPNVLLILMEGCGGTFVHAVDSLSDARITPHLNRLAQEGVVFTQAYANSFRTDRGTVCTLSGCPAFPDLSVMKVPTLCEKLPSIASSLRKAGYTTSFLYGGDINFTNTHGYLQSTGYERIDGEEAFPSSVRHTHNWGVTDRITFDTLYQRIVSQPVSPGNPWHIGFLTLASHEPWGVPYDRIKGDPVANSMAYLDDCIGQFVEKLRHTPQWANTLIILLPDHGIGYPEGISQTDERMSHIPIIFTGGAVKEPRRIDKICNQTDLAATLLGQLGLPHSEFRLSRDVLSTTYTHPSAVHTWQEGIYYKDASGISVVNLLTNPVSTFRESPHPSVRRVNAAKALLQTSYKLLK